MNKFLIMATAAACLGLVGCEDRGRPQDNPMRCHNLDEHEIIRIYGLDIKNVCGDKSRSLVIVGELKMIRELLQKQVALEAARQRSSKGPNPLCE